MGRFISDEIDDACELMLGHTNWAYADTISDEDMAEHIKNKAIECTVVFFTEPSEEEEYDDE